MGARRDQGKAKENRFQSAEVNSRLIPLQAGPPASVRDLTIACDRKAVASAPIIPLPGLASAHGAGRVRARAASLMMGPAVANRAATTRRLCYHWIMTTGIAGPGRKAPGQNAVVNLIIVAVAIGICLSLL